MSPVAALILVAVSPASVRLVDCRMADSVDRHNLVELLADVVQDSNLFFECVVRHLDAEHCESWVERLSCQGAAERDHA